MKNSLGQNEYVHAEFFSLASQLYVRLRRQQGRVIDSVYMTQNQDYALEVLRLARVNADADMHSLIQRIAAFVPAARHDMPLLDKRVDDALNSASAYTSNSAHHEGAILPSERGNAHNHDYAQKEVAHHYIGALR